MRQILRAAGIFGSAVLLPSEMNAQYLRLLRFLGRLPAGPYVVLLALGSLVIGAGFALGTDTQGPVQQNTAVDALLGRLWPEGCSPIPRRLRRDHGGGIRPGTGLRGRRGGAVGPHHRGEPAGPCRLLLHRPVPGGRVGFAQFLDETDLDFSGHRSS